MQLLKSLIILIVGFVLLIKGADFFVEAEQLCTVAKRLRIPSMIIGTTMRRPWVLQPSGMCSQCNCFPDRQ